ncbi:hypothetical protein [Jiangella muralis]|nr:hypothetical protein [Jiangella muralis]
MTRWSRDDWIALAALLALLVGFVLLTRDAPPTIWIERDFR